MRTRVDDAIAVVVVTALVAGAGVWAAFHLLGPRGDEGEVTVFPVGLTCVDEADGDEGEFVDLPLVEQPDVAEGERPHSLEASPPGYRVALQPGSRYFCELRLGVTNLGDATITVDATDVGGWAPGEASGDPWEMAPKDEVIGEVEVVDEVVARYVVDEELPTGVTTTVPLVFRQREDGCLLPQGTQTRGFGVTVSTGWSERMVRGGFVLATVGADDGRTACP